MFFESKSVACEFFFIMKKKKERKGYRLTRHTRDKNIITNEEFNVHNLYRVLKVLIRMEECRTTSERRVYIS